MYTQIHTRYIVQGVDLVDMLSREDSPGEVAQKQEELEKFADDAASAIKDLCTQVRITTEQFPKPV